MKRREFLKGLGAFSIALGFGRSKASAAVAAERIGESRKIFSGIAELNKLTVGFTPGELVVVGGRPSMGKTTFGSSIAWNASVIQRKRASYFAVETSKETVIRRMLSQATSITSWAIKTGRLKDEDWPKLIAATKNLAGASFFVKDKQDFRTSDIEESILARNVDVVIVDYLQLVRSTTNEISRTAEVNTTLAKLKNIAVEEKLVMIVLTQLNRGVVGSDVRKPNLKHIREVSDYSSIDTAILLHRDRYYDLAVQKNEMEFHVVKSKHGRCGIAKASLNPIFGMWS